MSIIGSLRANSLIDTEQYYLSEFKLLYHFWFCYSRNGRSTSTAAVKSTDDQEMTAKKHTDDVPQGCNYVYVNTVDTQPNPSYESISEI